MIILLSPAKTVDFSKPLRVQPPSSLTFAHESNALIEILKSYNLDELMVLMDISKELALLTLERINGWHFPFNLSQTQNAIYAFRGEAYNGFDADSLTEQELGSAEEKLIILSGLFGILHPLDAILPYRLEMGAKLPNDFGANLYPFWRIKITNQLNKLLLGHEDKVVVNLASEEYWKCITKSELIANVITPQFLDFSNGRYKTVSVYAKKARGAMARFLLGTEIKSHKDLIAFQLLDYHYDAARSSDEIPVFIRH